MGKFSGIVEQLPKLIDTQPAVQERVELYKQQVEDKTPTGLVVAWFALRAEQEALKRKRSWLHIRQKAVEQLLMSAYEGSDVDRIVLVSGLGLGYAPQPHPGFHKALVFEDGSWNAVEDPTIAQAKLTSGEAVPGREVFRRYCVERGLQAEMHLHSSTTKSMLSEALVGGEPIPPGIKPWQKPKFNPTGLKHMVQLEDAQEPPAGDLPAVGEDEDGEDDET